MEYHGVRGGTQTQNRTVTKHSRQDCPKTHKQESLILESPWKNVKKNQMALDLSPNETRLFLFIAGYRLVSRAPLADFARFELTRRYAASVTDGRKHR